MPEANQSPSEDNYFAQADKFIHTVLNELDDKEELQQQFYDNDAVALFQPVHSHDEIARQYDENMLYARETKRLKDTATNAFTMAAAGSLMFAGGTIALAATQEGMVKNLVEVGGTTAIYIGGLASLGFALRGLVQRKRYLTRSNVENKEEA